MKGRNRYLTSLALILILLTSSTGAAVVDTLPNDFTVDSQIILNGSAHAGRHGGRLAFQYRPIGQTGRRWQRTPWERFSRGRTNTVFRAPISGLTNAVAYEFRAVGFVRGRSRIGKWAVMSRAPQDLDAFVIGGQSNAQGGGSLLNAETNGGLAWMLGADCLFKPAYEPTHDTTGNIDPIALPYPSGHSAWLRMANALGRSATLVPCAVGSTGLQVPVTGPWRLEWILTATNRWDRSTLYGRMNSRAALCRNVKAYLWFGHESSARWAFEGTWDLLATYKDDWRTMMQQIRQDASNVPIICAQLAHRALVEDEWAIQMNMGAEIHRQLEDGQPGGFPGCHMVVTFDVPMSDSVHLSAEGNKIVGERFALAVRKYVYGENVDATGPRLKGTAPVTLSNAAPGVITIQFDREINESLNNYDDQFRVYGDAAEIVGLRAQRAASGSAVEIERADGSSYPTDGTLLVTYGERVATHFEAITNVVKDSHHLLPAPQFRLPVQRR